MIEGKTYRTTVMFADVSGSSRLYKQLGDLEANRHISGLVRRMAEIVETHGGAIIKTIGDEIMAQIADPQAAHDAAVAIQQAATAELPVRIGMAWGEVIERDADLFGETVNDAAAVAKIARGGQVITTEAFKAQLSGDGLGSMRLFDRIRLKGALTESGLYRLEWATEELSADDGHTTVGVISGSRQEQLSLTFTGADGLSNTLVIHPEDTPFVIGRVGGRCQIAIHKSYVSREHCKIDYGHNRFILRDHSTNGTYVTTALGETLFIRRGEYPLAGSGSIAVGKKPDGVEPNVIGFSL